MENQGIAVIERTVTATALPDEQTFRDGLTAIKRFQAIAKTQMIEGHDYGVIPGTNKPTLLKPGAETITKLLGLADEYVILEQTIDWNKPFFHYLIKASLRHMGTGVVISEGVGECNSYESKYRYRWVFQSQLPEGEKPTVTRTINTKKGKAKQFRLENEDIFSQVNTILKMAKKRAMVDAALSAGRLSDVFTQDMEDLPPLSSGEDGPSAQPDPDDALADFAALKGPSNTPETPNPSAAPVVA
jgi:hypothetical protein